MVRFTMYCLYHFYTPCFPFIPFQYASSPTASPPFCSPSRVSRGNDTLRTPKLVYLTSRCSMFSRLQICSLLCFRNLGGLSCSSISIAAVIRLYLRTHHIRRSLKLACLEVRLSAELQMFAPVLAQLVVMGRPYSAWIPQTTLEPSTVIGSFW